jgi:hypothetical protein
MDYWPLDGNVEENLEETVETFARALATVRYEQCADGHFEDGVEKIALYAKRGKVIHGAKQTSRQQWQWEWQSKMGPDEDIEHPLDGLEGPLFGKVVAYFKRARVVAQFGNEPIGIAKPPDSIMDRFLSFLYRLIGSPS